MFNFRRKIYPNANSLIFILEMNPVIIAHGGIEYGRSNCIANDKQIALKNAVIQGYAVLRVGNSSVDAVETTIRILEDDQHFNAGYGSVLNSDGNIELDAGIMNGTGLKVGSVGALKDIAHPITVAKYVMESTDHSLLVGEGAQKFAMDQNVPVLPRGSLIHKSAIVQSPGNFSLQNFEEFLIFESEKYFVFLKNSLKAPKYFSHPKIKTLQNLVSQLPFFDPVTDWALIEAIKPFEVPETCTVGIVAIDTMGKCTVGTSSGGGFNKMPGRVGSSAIVGGGFYADSSIGGSVATGHGESIVKSCLCFNLVSQMKVQKLHGDLTMLAVKNVVETATRQSKNSIGVVALDRNGEFGVAFSAPRMPWAYCRLGELRFGAESGENYKEFL